MTDEKQATHDDICDGLLRHYDALAERAHHLDSAMAKAIEAYRRYPLAQAQRGALYAWSMHVKQSTASGMPRINVLHMLNSIADGVGPT